MIVILVVVGAAVGFYFLVYRPRRAAESRVVIQTAAKSAATFLRAPVAT